MRIKITLVDIEPLFRRLSGLTAKKEHWDKMFVFLGRARDCSDDIYWVVEGDHYHTKETLELVNTDGVITYQLILNEWFGE